MNIDVLKPRKSFEFLCPKWRNDEKIWQKLVEKKPEK